MYLYYVYEYAYYVCVYVYVYYVCVCMCMCMCTCMCMCICMCVSVSVSVNMSKTQNTIPVASNGAAPWRTSVANYSLSDARTLVAVYEVACPRESHDTQADLRSTTKKIDDEKAR